jgi:hypothetical protein
MFTVVNFKYFYIFIYYLLSLFFTVDLNVSEQVSSTYNLFQPYLVAFAEQLFVFTLFEFYF